MARYVAWAFAALLLVPGAGSAAGLCEKGQDPSKQGAAAGTGKPDSGHQPTKWWVEPKLRQELGITDQQSAALEAIWQNGLQERIEKRTRLDQLEAALDQRMTDASGDEASITRLVDKVEAARTEVSKGRTLLLYRMNKILTPEQRLKLAAKAKAMREQRSGGGRGEPHPGDGRNR
jgi:Spy/CpxP family protein refolding chaperone